MIDTLDRILALAGDKFGSDAAFEKALGVKPKTIDNWRRRRSKAYAKQITQIAGVLGTTAAYLLGESGDAGPKKTASPGEAEAEAFNMLVRLGVLEPDAEITKEKLDILLSHFRTFADGLLK